MSIWRETRFVYCPALNILLVFFYVFLPTPIFLNYLRISYNVSHPSCFPSLPCQVTHPCSFPNKGEKKIPVHLYSPCTQGSIVNNCPVASPLKNTESFPPTPSLPETINCEELHCCIFIPILKDFLQWFLSKLFLFQVWGGTVMVEGLPQKPSMVKIGNTDRQILHNTVYKWDIENPTP